MLCATAVLGSCTAKKIKSARSLSASGEALTYMDSSFSESRLGEFKGQGSEIYDGLWWLKGNVQISLDSGIRADEVGISYRGISAVRQLFKDSVQQSFRQTAIGKEKARQSLDEKHKVKESIFKLPWWVYVILLGVVVFVVFRSIRRCRGVLLG